MTRLRLYDVRVSRLPGLVGLCADNVPAIAGMVNSAQRRLLYAKEAGEEGWNGTWAEIAFNVSRSLPYITLPREIARIEVANGCTNPIVIQNQFFEFLRFGNGSLPKSGHCGGGGLLSGYARNNAVTFTDLTSAPQLITVYATDAADAGKRILIQGLDADGGTIYSQDVQNQVMGEFLTLSALPTTTSMTLSRLTGIQKDITVGVVRIYQHDPTTGDEVLLLTMQPGEQTASYRRYYLNSLPQGCCSAPGATDASMVQITAIAKLELIPVVVDTDYCLIQNLEAIIEECQSVRYSEMDSPSAKQMAAERHMQAIRLLNGELSHYNGLEPTAIGFSPFGSARLNRRKVGRLV